MRKRNSKKGHYIFRASIRHPKTGKRIYARQYGLKAFKIWVED